MWLVYLEDTNGSRRLVGNYIDLLTKEDADQAINNIIAKHSKPHKIDYYKIEYTLETKLQIIKELNIHI